MQISKVYEREVRRIREVSGPKGGRYLVLDLVCNHWVAGRTPRQKVRCIVCYTIKHNPQIQKGPNTVSLETENAELRTKVSQLTAQIDQLNVQVTDRDEAYENGRRDGKQEAADEIDILRQRLADAEKDRVDDVARAKAEAAADSKRRVGSLVRPTQALNARLDELRKAVEKLVRARDTLVVALKELGIRRCSQTCLRQAAHDEADPAIRTSHCQCGAAEHNLKVLAILKEFAP